MSVKYTMAKWLVRRLNAQSLMAQPYDKLQKMFKTEKAFPIFRSSAIRIISLKRSKSAAIRYCM